jgi:hypothetical protein
LALHAVRQRLERRTVKERSLRSIAVALTRADASPAFESDSGGRMSRRNGDRARFHKDRKRRIQHRARMRAAMAAAAGRAPKAAKH